jgi:Transposase DDE domain
MVGMNTNTTKPKRESRYVRVARIAYRLTQQTLPSYSHPKSPHHFTLPQLAACVLMAFYMKLSYRDMEEWLLASDAVCQALELPMPRVPDHSTLARTYNKLRVTYNKLRVRDFDKMKGSLLSELGVQGTEEVLASDTTSFSLTGASAYYQTRSGRLFREWVKGAYCVGTRSQLILSWRTGRGPDNDAPFLAGLRRDARRYGCYQGKRRAWLMTADSGFDGRGVEEGDLIPPIRRGPNARVVDPARKARADLVSQARLDGVYGQRWKTETVNSVIKRRFGSAIRSRKFSLQHREPIIKGLVYNIHV